MADQEKQLTLNVTTKHQAAVKGLVAVGGSLQSIGDQAKRAQQSLKNINAYKDLIKQTGEAKAAWKSAEQQVKELAAGIKASNAPTKQQVAEFNRAVAAAGKLKAQYAGNNTALAGLRQKLTATGIDTKNLSAEQARLGTAFDAAKQQAIAATKIDLARGILDVDNPRKVQQEITRLKAAYARLEAAEKSGSISSKELAQAKTNLKSKINELSGATTKYTKTSKLSLAQLGGMASGFYGVVRAAKALISATSAGETSTYLLSSAIDAANRQFEVGSMADWGERIRNLSAELRIFSQTELETATAKTIEMTKRLGLSADQMQTLITVSANLSAGKTDLAGGIERTTAALRGEAESAEYLGLTLNEDYVKSWYKANTAHAKAWSTLTDLEKAQVRYQVLLDQATGTEGRAADSITTLAGAWQYMQAKMNDAIRNNEDLKAAISEVTSVISENAGSIVKLIATLVSAAGKTAEWIIQHKELALAIVGGLAGFKAFGGSLSVILGIITSMKAAGVPDIISGQSGKISAGLTARIGLYGLLATTLLATAKAAYDWYKAEQLATQARNNAISSAQQLTEKTKEYKAALVPTKDNIFSASAADLITMRQELHNAYAYWLAQETELSEKLAQEKSKWFVDDELVAQLEANLATAQAKMQEYHGAWQAVEKQITATGAAAEASAGKQAQVMGDVAALAQALAKEQEKVVDKQNLLNKALADSEPTIANLKNEVNKTTDAFYEAAKALEAMQEGQEGYDKAQKKMLQARKDYVASVKALNDQLWEDASRTYSEEEQALENSLERRKLQLDKWLQNDIISREEYAYQITKAEEEMQAQILLLREQAAIKAAEIYGRDSDQYKQAVQQKIDAELELQRLKNDKQETLGDLTNTNSGGTDSGTSGTGTGSGGSGNSSGVSFSDREKQVMEDVINGVYRGVKPSNGQTQQEAQDEYNALRASVEQKLKQQQEQADADEKNRRTGVASGFYGNWDSITNTINDMTSLDQLRSWYQDNRKNLLKNSLSMSSLTQALAKHAQDVYRARVSELKANEREEKADAAASTSTSTSTTKTMTINLKTATGATVSGTFAESDASKLISLLQQAGLTTA